MPVPCCLECVRVLPADGPCPVCGKTPETLEPRSGPKDRPAIAYNALREWTRRQARVQGGEPYMVLPKAVVARLALLRPHTREELRRVKGLGPVKDKDYGALLVRWLADLDAERDPGEVPVARAPMPEGLTEDEEAAVLALREARAPLGEVLPGPDPLAAVAALVDKGATDLVRLLVSPFEFALALRELEAGASAEELRARGLSETAVRLVPLVAGEPAAE